MAEKKKDAKRAVTLKRSVTIKAIVTDKFKEFMKVDIDAAISQTQGRMDQIDTQLKDQSIAPVVREKLILERDQHSQTMREMSSRKTNLKTMENGSQFVQGVIDGYVSVSVGDNLYEKLGGLEIILEDGIVKDIAQLKPNA